MYAVIQGLVMRILAGAFSLLIVGMASNANALTPAEAQTLSVAELAKRVLGEAGLDMQDVDRPGWGPAPPGDPMPRPPAEPPRPWPD